MKTFAVLTTAAMFSCIISANAGNDNHPSLSAMAVTTPALETVSAPASIMEVATEASLEVESWMTNESFFVPLVVSETEEPMGVEEWMINHENFMETIFIEESEQSLELEPWMLDNKNFSTYTITEETEKVLEIESWMLNENTWGR